MADTDFYPVQKHEILPSLHVTHQASCINLAVACSAKQFAASSAHGIMSYVLLLMHYERLQEPFADVLHSYMMFCQRQ